jgi:RNA polymerase sigma-70 factor, ECF subfamily
MDINLQNFDATIALCQEGDAPAWEALVRHYQGRVYAVAWYYLKNRDEAVDAAQDTFIKVYAQLDSFRGSSEAFLPWLLTITRNCSIDRIRKNNTRKRYEEDFSQSMPLEDHQSNPEMQLLSAKSVSLFYRALEKLNPVNRDIVLLKDIQGLKLKDVARILSLPVGTIKSRSTRARIELSKLLTELKGQN